MSIIFRFSLFILFTLPLPNYSWDQQNLMTPTMGEKSRFRKWMDGYCLFTELVWVVYPAHKGHYSYWKSIFIKVYYSHGAG